MGNETRAGRTAIASYFREIRQYPLLSVEREKTIAARAGGPIAEPLRNELVTSSLGFVVRVALEFRGCGLPLEDLLNEGNLGLIEAARHYDPARGTRFITCAVWWIRKAILKALEQHASLVRVPSYQLQNARRVRRTAQRLSALLGRDAERQDLSDEMGLAPSKIDAILGSRMHGLSLDEPIGDDSSMKVVDRLIDRRLSDPETALLARERAAMVRRLVPRLEEKERWILTRRFGLDGGDPMTLKEVGELLGVSREAIRLAERQVLKRLRRMLMRERLMEAPTSSAARQSSDDRPSSAPKPELAPARFTRDTRIRHAVATEASYVPGKCPTTVEVSSDRVHAN